jgi:pilus assembly protein Flp/PilA
MIGALAPEAIVSRGLLRPAYSVCETRHVEPVAPVSNFRQRINPPGIGRGGLSCPKLANWATNLIQRRHRPSQKTSKYRNPAWHELCSCTLSFTEMRRIFRCGFERERIMRKFLADFLSNESGVTAIEYGLITAGIAVAIIVAVQSVGTALNANMAAAALAITP